MDQEPNAELERRLVLIESGADGEGILPPLPFGDVLAALAGLVVLGAGLLWWAL